LDALAAIQEALDYLHLCLVLVVVYQLAEHILAVVVFQVA
jgi:hypothetical protein